MFLSILSWSQIFTKQPRLATIACGFWSLLTVFLGTPAMAQRNVVVVRPKEIQDVLVNPGMGITTFQRFNGQEPNPPLKWSEVGPVTKLPAAATTPTFRKLLYRIAVGIGMCLSPNPENSIGELSIWRLRRRERTDKSLPSD